MSKKHYITRTTTLTNGLRVVCVETPHLQSAYAGLVIGVGSRHEAAADNGLSHFLEHMVFRGTQRFTDARDLNAAAESIGGSLDAATYRDHTQYGTVTHPSRMDTALALIAEIVMRPRFRHMETERAIIKEEMRESFGSHGQMIDVDTLAHSILYAGHGLAQPIEGVEKNVDRFRKHDLVRHLKTHYTAARSILVLAGCVRLRDVLPLVKKHFAKLPRGTAITRTPPPKVARRETLRLVSDPGAQVDLRVSYPSLAATDPDYSALSVLSRVLGEGLSSRLHSELIDQKGLAYSLGAGPEVFNDCGTFDFDVAVAPEKVVRTCKELLRFAETAVKKPPSKKEVALAKERYTITLDFMADAPGDLALWVARAWLQGIDADFDRAAARFLAVTPKDCARVATRVFADVTPTLCAVGQFATKDRQALRRLFSA